MYYKKSHTLRLTISTFRLDLQLEVLTGCLARTSGGRSDSFTGLMGRRWTGLFGMKVKALGNRRASVCALQIPNCSTGTAQNMINSCVRFQRRSPLVSDSNMDTMEISLQQNCKITPRQCGISTRLSDLGTAIERLSKKEKIMIIDSIRRAYSESEDMHIKYSFWDADTIVRLKILFI